MSLSIEQRVREFCELSSLVNSTSKQFFPKEYYECASRVNSPILTKEFDEWHLRSLADWDRLIEKEIIWIFSNKRAVMEVLPKIEKEWPSMCDNIKIMCGFF